MVQWRIVKNLLEEIREITGCDFLIFDRKNSVLLQTGFLTAEKLPQAFLASEEQIFAADGLYVKKITASELPVSLLAVSGEGAQTAGRMAAAALAGLQKEAESHTDRPAFFRSVLLGTADPVSLSSEQRRFRIGTDGRYFCCLFRMREQDLSAADSTLRSAFSAGFGGADVIPVSGCEIVLLLSDLQGKRETPREEAELAEDVLHTEAMIPVRIAVSTRAESLSGLTAVFREARTALEVARIFFPDRTLLYMDELGIGRLIYELSPELCRRFLEETFHRDDIFRGIDQESMTIIREFFANNLNVAETARKLFMHRNTLVYRIDRLQKETGLDLRRFEDAMTFRIAMMADARLKG